MENAWQKYILEHPTFSKPGMIDKFVEMNSNDFEGKNEVFGENFRLMMFKRSIRPKNLITAIPFNEGILVACYMGYAPKGEVLDSLCEVLKVDKDTLFTPGMEL